ncbi:MAG: hypothetical protein ABSE71_03320 [Candidatus Micrarchaeaceae archaeon]|jgi:hypothetical protein
MTLKPILAKNAGARTVSDAESFIKLTLAKSFVRKDDIEAAAEVEMASSRQLVYSAVYANHGRLSGIIFALEGSPPRGTIFASPISWWKADEPDGWKVVDFHNVSTITDSGLEKAINAFMIERNIPVQQPPEQFNQQLRREAGLPEKEPEKPAE